MAPRRARGSRSAGAQTPPSSSTQWRDPNDRWLDPTPAAPPRGGGRRLPLGAGCPRSLRWHEQENCGNEREQDAREDPALLELDALHRRQRENETPPDARCLQEEDRHDR